MGCRIRILRRVSVVLLFMGLLVLMRSVFVSTHRSKEVFETESPARRLIAEKLKHLEQMGGRKAGFSDEDSDLNYVSRRRIPCGPDPIHNRRVVRFRVPPAKL